MSSDKKDLDAAFPLAAALMQTPRDVARLETQLLVTAKELAGDVNLADVLLIEALNIMRQPIVRRTSPAQGKNS